MAPRTISSRFHSRSVTYGSVDTRQNHGSGPPPSSGGGHMPRHGFLEVGSPGRAEANGGGRSWPRLVFVCLLASAVVAVAITHARSRGVAAETGIWPFQTEELDDEPIALGTATDRDTKLRTGSGPATRVGAIASHVGTTQGVVTASSLADGSPPLEFTALNFYHVRDGKPGAEYPWLQNVKVVEPYRETMLSVVSPLQGFQYKWSARGIGCSDDEEGAQAVDVEVSGEAVDVVLTCLDENVIFLEEVDSSSGQVTRRLEETVMVKYVRREIRALTDDDREELLEAMATLWEVSAVGGEGKELFGEDYTDVWSMARLHYTAASQVTCDHFHDGLGFLTSHTILTNTFEHSLQLVNPKLTLPYWDYTIESTYDNIEETDGIRTHPEPQRLSPLLQTSWFGSSDPDDQQVKDGRWAYTSVPRVDERSDVGFGDVLSRLRAPWTVNQRPHLSRGLGDICGYRVQETFPWPTCKSHYDLTTKNNNFYSWVWDSQYDPHGNVHIWLGGVLDCAEAYSDLTTFIGEEYAAELASLSFVHRKDLYRDGLWYCTTEDTQGRGMLTPAGSTCGCLGHDLEAGDDYVDLLSKLHLSQLAHYDESTKRKVVSTICNAAINDGDHLQSSSAMDPMFWPMHPTIERLWVFKQLTGTLVDVNWPDEDTSVTLSDGTPYMQLISLYSETCIGHRGSDVYPFGLPNTDAADVITGIVDRDDGNVEIAREAGDVAPERSRKVEEASWGYPVGENKYTNREVLKALDPRMNVLTYIYDTFRWDHCLAEGYNFANARHPEDTENFDKVAPRVGETRLPTTSRSTEGEKSHSGSTKR